MVAAARLYVQMGYKLPAKWVEFATTWVQRYLHREPMTPRKPPGRKPLLPDDVIRKIATEYMPKGVGRGKSWRPYLSVEEVGPPQQGAVLRCHAGPRRSPRRRQRPWNHPKLHFLYGVHWKLGVLGPYWVHDCTGWKRARKWQASSMTHLVPVGDGEHSAIAP